MSDENKGLFRREALEHMSSPDRLDQLIRIVSPKDWLLLGALLLLTGLLLAWCVWGQLPTTVSGQGVIIRPRRIVELQSQASGRLVEFSLQVGDTIAKGDVVGLIDQAEIRKQLQEDQVRLAELNAQDQEKKSLQNQQIELQEREIEAQKKFLDLQGNSLEMLIKDAQALAPILKKRMESRKKMIEEGLIPKVSDEAFLAEKEYLENQSRIAELQAQLREIDSQVSRLDTEMQELTRQMFEASSTRKNEMLALKKNIALYEVQLDQNSKIISEYTGTVLEITTTLGQVLNTGSRIASIEVQEAGSDPVCVTYFSIGDGKRIQSGMTIQVTPDTVKRERFGAILGAVSTVSAFPVTEEAATLLLGNPEVAQRLLGSQPQIEVVARLERDASTISGFRWSSSKGPPIPITTGTTTTARVIVEQRPPISYILPFLRSVSGIY
jgi:HlyD family secretion protein